ncbi:MAG: hypothetical protein P9L99_11590 [Candidatus Lernaella stagnicola]|nr:hypothetical protein [Candidatus Lernaella stagnicola]
MKFHRWPAVAACLALLAILAIPCVAAADERPELTPEFIEWLRTNVEPMPFPNVDMATPVSDESVRWVFKYNEAERPPLAELGYDIDTGNPLPVFAEEKTGGPSKINNTQQFPYSSVVHLYMRYDDMYAGCSGAFIQNSSTVFTAGHCIYNHDFGGFPDDIIVIPAEESGQKPFGQAYAHNWASNTGWTNYQDYTKDYAAIVVEPFGDNTGYMDSFYTTSANWYMGREFHTAGYPGDFGYTGDEMWWEENRVVEVTSGMMRVNYHFGDDYPYFCIPGQSGSAMYFDNDGVWSIAAVLTLGSCHGVRINSTVQELIDSFACDGCLVGDVCYKAGDRNPDNSCEICDPSQLSVGWSSNDGLACNDGLWCTGDDFCFEGACEGHKNYPCDAFQECVEEAQECIGEPLDDDDELDVCEDLLSLLYDQCGFAVPYQNGFADSALAYSLCLENNANVDWNCLTKCSISPNVQNCGDFAECMNSACDVSVKGYDGDSDDDDGGGGCGG